MSHIVQITTQVRDPVAVAATCRRLNLPQPVHGTVKLFSGEVTGHRVELPRWRYPIVCDTQKGTLHYDNYNGAWGDRQQLDQFLQTYAVEKTRIESRRQGHSMTEHALPDGSIRLAITVGGAS